MNLEEIKAAQTRILTRRGLAVRRISEIEANRPRLIMSYAAGEIEAAELDTLAAELPKLREVANEDNTAALEHFARLERQELERQRLERNRQEILEQRRAWAVQYNMVLNRTHPPTPQEVEDLAVTRPGDFSGYLWERLTNGRIDFASLPETDQTFGSFAGLTPFDPEL